MRTIKVELMSCTDNPIETIYRAYRTCYSKEVPTKITAPTEDKMCEFIKKYIHHESPLEHAKFTFSIEGVSRSLLAQITRHRTMQFSVQSQRYVRSKQFEYVTPPEIEKDVLLNCIYEEHMKRTQNIYDVLTEGLLDKYCYYYITKDTAIYDEGVSLQQARRTLFSTDKKKYREFEKKAIEDARYVFPNACFTNMVMTVDLRNFRHFYDLRSCIDAQWEIRALSDMLMDKVKQIVPFADYNVKSCGVTCFECGNLTKDQKYDKLINRR